MKNKLATSSLIFSLYIVISFYVLGGSMINSFVAYKSWRLVGAEEFAQFHQVDSKQIIPVLFTFVILSFIFQFFLILSRPPAIKRWMVGLAFLFNLIPLIATLYLVNPIQAHLDLAFSSDLIEKLISADFFWRRIPLFFLAAINFVMLYKVVRSSSSQ